MNPSEKAVYVYRGDYIESTHIVHIAVTDQEGNLLYAFGNPERPTFPRSSMKPFQAVPIVETGTAAAFSFHPKELALACSSHSGEPQHRSGISSILERVGLHEDDLQCGTHAPWHKESRENLYREHKEPTAVCNNCSGKHAGMLATAVHMKEDPATYREIHHPVQERILDAIADICSYPKEKIAISMDGCGAPVHRLPLKNMALGFARLAHPNEGKHREALQQIRDAMMAHPSFVAGINRFDTDLMKTFYGNIVSKMGAEGVQCVGLVDKGYGMAIKVEDGSSRAVGAVVMKVLKTLGITNQAVDQQLEKYIHPSVKNIRGENIGKIEVDFKLKKI